MANHYDLIVYFLWHVNEWGEVWHVYGLSYQSGIAYDRIIEITKTEAAAAAVAHMYGRPVLKAKPKEEGTQRALEALSKIGLDG